MEAVPNILLPEKESFYVSERSSFELKRTGFQESLKTYQIEVRKILKQLQKRQKDIFNALVCADVDVVSDELQRNIEALNRLIIENNAITNTLAERRQEARDELRLNEVARLIRDIDLSSEKQKVADLHCDARSSNEEAKS